MFINSYFFKNLQSLQWDYWQQGTLPSAKTVTAAVYGTDFIALTEEGYALKSSDGLSWTEHQLPSIQAPQRWWSIAYGNGKYIALTMPSNNLAYSTNGEIWFETVMPLAPVSLNPISRWYALTFADGKFIAIGKEQGGAERHISAVSTDGFSWSVGVLPVTPQAAFGDVSDIAFGNGKFVAITTVIQGPATADVPGISFSSTDGINWAQSVMPKGDPDWFNEYQTWASVTFGDGKFVAVTANYRPGAVSTDGVNWTLSNMPADADWANIEYSNGKYFSTLTDTNFAASSANGTNWQAELFPGNPVPYGGVVVASQNKFIIFATTKSDLASDYTFIPSSSASSDSFLISTYSAQAPQKFDFKQQLDFQITGANTYFSSPVISADSSVIVAAGRGTTVGGVGGAGAAFVFMKTGSSWERTQMLTPDTSQVNGYFGSSVSMSSDSSVIAIGYPNFTDAGFLNSGAVTLFDRVGANYVKNVTLTSQTPANSKRFGFSHSLSADGRTLVVTSLGTAAEVFVKTGSVWSKQADLVPPNFATNQRYGDTAKISADGSTIAVSSPFRSVGVASNAGRVQIFSWDGTSWTHQAELNTTLYSSNAWFGRNNLDLSADGNTLVAAEAPKGLAYVFARTGTSWMQQAVLSSGLGPSDYFGYGLAISPDGQTVATSSSWAVFDRPWAGAVFIFKKNVNGWSCTQRFASSTVGELNEFGYRMSLNANNIAISSEYLQNPIGIWTGAVEVFKHN